MGVGLRSGCEFDLLSLGLIESTKRAKKCCRELLRGFS